MPPLGSFLNVGLLKLQGLAVSRKKGVETNGLSSTDFFDF